MSKAKEKGNMLSFEKVDADRSSVIGEVRHVADVNVCRYNVSVVANNGTNS